MQKKIKHSLFAFGLCAIICLASACKKEVLALPVAAFGVSSTNWIAPSDVVFNNTSTGESVTYQWDFGDGGVSVEVSPTHRYTTAGTYDIKLTATNSGGSNIAVKKITIKSPPSAYTKCFITNIIFLQIAGGDITSFQAQVKDNLNNILGGTSSNDGYLYSTSLPAFKEVYQTFPITAINDTSRLSLTYDANGYAMRSIPFKAVNYQPPVGSATSVDTTFNIINTQVGGTWSMKVGMRWFQ